MERERWIMLADYWNGHMMDSGAGWVWMSLMMIVAVVAVVLAVWVIVRASSGTHQPIGRSAKDILDERYARGEIDTADYEERLRKLR
jgi:putative membrane protein